MRRFLPLLAVLLLLAACGATSRQQIVRLAAFTPVEATHVAATGGVEQVTVSWEASGTTNLLHWLVEYEPKGGAWTKAPELPASARSDTLSLAAGSYGLRVWAVVKQDAASTTATVTAKEEEHHEEPPPPPPGKGCFEHLEACGLPAATDTGVQDCPALPHSSAGMTITSEGETVENTDIAGYVTVGAARVTLRHDCVEPDGGEGEVTAIGLTEAASDFTIEDSTVRGTNTTSGSVEEALRNNYSDPGAKAVDVRLENCSECLHQQWTLEGSYVISNGREKAEESGQSHAEDWWVVGGSIVANHDTLLNPSKQTGTIFYEGKSTCANSETVTNSLLAGGGFTMYFCANSSTASSSTWDIQGNRFARKDCTGKQIPDVQGRGGTECSGKPGEAEGYFDSGEGAGGYYPLGGFFGLISIQGTGQPKGTWANNVWDDDSETVGP